MELIKSLKVEIKQVKVDKENTRAERAHAVAELKRREEAASRQAVAEEQARRQREEATASASKELELKKSELKAKINEAAQQERMSMLGELQFELKVINSETTNDHPVCASLNPALIAAQRSSPTAGR